MIGRLENNNDKTLWENYGHLNEHPHDGKEKEPETYTVYVPLKLSPEIIKGKLEAIIDHFGLATDENEDDYCVGVYKLIEEIAAYDEMVKRERGLDTLHCKEAEDLAMAMADMLIDVNNGRAEGFPIEAIMLLSGEYRLQIEEDDIG